MLFITILMMTAAVVLSHEKPAAKGEPPGCGKLSDQLLHQLKHGGGKRSSILGGHPFTSLDVPFVVRVDRDGVPVCTGTLISKDRVATAAHCVTLNDTNTGKCKPDKAKFTVCIYADNNSEACRDSNRIEIKQPILHMQTFMEYGCVRTYDFVILELLNAAKKTLRIAPACLPRPANGIFANHNYLNVVYSAGYSDNWDMDSNNGPNKRLKIGKADPPIFPTGYKVLLLTVPKTKGDYGVICGGDSGGPLFELVNDRAVLIGINVNANWRCRGNDYELDGNKKHFQTSVAILPRLGNLNGTLFPTFG